jgi:hypothetical protein
MKKILLLVMGAMMLVGSVSAQSKMAPNSSSTPSHRTCGTAILPDDFENWMDDQIKADRAAGNTGKAHVVYTLPVVVHIIHNGSAVGSSYNLSDAQILSQIAVLNEDYRKLNADAALVPTVWQGVAVDCEINFCLAQRDPNGAATTGIDRINRNSKGWTPPPYAQAYVDATIKPNSIWNVNKYLNIWVCALSGGLLGYATFPPSSTLSGLSAPYGTTTTDGVVIQYNAFGRVGTLDATYNKGRSATHEIGHWLGLRHIWGDGNCATDYCNDTPTQSTANFGCPSFPQVTCSNGPNGDMWMNYMDYTDDPCMYMFSNNQKTRMTTVLTHTPYRVALAASDACNPPVVGVDENSELAKLSIFPNPTQGELSVLIAEQRSKGNVSFRVLNNIGAEVFSSSVPANASGNYKLNLANLSQGFYFVEIKTSEGSRIEKFQIAH